MHTSEMALFTTAAVDADTAIELRPPRTPGDTATIFLGGERCTLEFFDPESLQRLGDLAHEGARHLRARLTEAG